MKKSAHNSHFGFALKSGLFTLTAFFLALFFLPQLQTPTNKPCANAISCISDLSGKETITATGVFMDQIVTAPTLPQDTTRVLGDSTTNKRIVVDLATQTLRAYEGDQEAFAFLVSTGKWGKTPTGDFRIWIKLRATRMKGGSKAFGTFYDLPNVPYTMYFYNDQVPKSRGFGLHAAYWHNNFGHPMSHGCVNIGIEDAHRLYDWASPATIGNTTYASDDNPGTLVSIIGVAPQE